MATIRVDVLTFKDREGLERCQWFSRDRRDLILLCSVVAHCSLNGLQNAVMNENKLVRYGRRQLSRKNENKRSSIVTAFILAPFISTPPPRLSIPET